MPFSSSSSLPLPPFCSLCILPLSLLPTLSLDNRRESPPGGVLSSNAFPVVQSAESVDRSLLGVLSENGAPYLLSPSKDNAQALSGQDPSMDEGREPWEGSLSSSWVGQGPRHCVHPMPGDVCQRSCASAGPDCPLGGSVCGKRKWFPSLNHFRVVPSSSTTFME